MQNPEVIVVPIVFAIPAIVLLARMSFKHKEKMAHEIVGMWLMPELPFPSIGPVGRGAIAPQKIKRRGSKTHLNGVAGDGLKRS